MPSPPTTDLPMPKSWDEFEDITADVLKGRWETPHVTRNGRSGQPQNGVDIYGRAKHLDGGYAGAQCKRVDNISMTVIVGEVAKAETFKPPLKEYIIATTARRDAPLQEKIRLLTADRLAHGKFPV